MKRKKFWAGFVDGKIQEISEKYRASRCLAIYLSKTEAEERYQDVRPVEIKVLKK